MERPASFFKRLVIPVTPMVVLALLSLAGSIWGFIRIFTTDQPTAFLEAIVIAISQMVLVLYIIDRVIVKFLSYKQLFFGELFLLIVLIFSFFYSLYND